MCTKEYIIHNKAIIAKVYAWTTIINSGIIILFHNMFYLEIKSWNMYVNLKIEYAINTHITKHIYTVL